MTEKSDRRRGKPDLKMLRGELDGAEPSRLEPGSGGKTPRKPPPRDRGEIYRGSPVRALGVHGDTFFYLDLLGQLAPVTNHTRDRMRGIFGGRSDLLIREFPQFNRGGEVSGWNQEKTATAFMAAAAELGVWNAFERVRGLGAWPDGAGGVALHCGDKIWFQGGWREPGAIDGFVYPSSPAIPRPLEEAWCETPALEQLLDLLGTWNWQRGDLDAYLLAGWICAAMFGGALDWRPLVWITGDASTGKSTIQKVIRAVMGGEGAVLQSTDATEASVRQFLMQATIPVALDEIEADADNRKSLAVIKLARQAASGGVVLRGGADHKGQEFRARSAFAFSSILVPPLLDQDVSRIALLELMPLPRDVPAPAIDPRKWGRIGRELRRRILRQWPRHAATLDLYRRALEEAGHNARGQDQLGALLTLADLAMHAEAPDRERCDGWAARLGAAAVGEQTDQSSDWQRMLNHLLGQHLEPYRGGNRHTLGRWILAAAGLREPPDPHAARNALPAYGIKLEGRGDTARLVLANAHPNLAQLFIGTHWHAGGGQRGVWSQAAKRIPGAEATGALSFDGVSSRAWRFALASIPNLFADDQARDQAPDTKKPAPAGAGFDPEDFA